MEVVVWWRPDSYLQVATNDVRMRSANMRRQATSVPAR